MKERAGNIPVISVSAKEEQGIREFEDKIKEMFLKGDISFNDQIYITKYKAEKCSRAGFGKYEKSNSEHRGRHAGRFLFHRPYGCI